MFALCLKYFEQKKAELPSRNLIAVTFGSPAFLSIGSVTFCPYLTVGLASVLKSFTRFVIYITHLFGHQLRIYVCFILL